MISDAVGTAAAIHDAGSALDLSLTARQTEQLAAFVALLGRWNQTYNLTAVRDPAAIVTHHVADCLAAVTPLRRELATTDSPHLLDVGSGGGLPGLVLAALNPDWTITCVDSVGKKAAFIRQAASELGLGRVSVRHARVERLADPVGYDVVTARAFASLGELAAATVQLLAPGGRWMAMKGKTPDEEMASLPASIGVFHVERVSVPGLSANRCLVWMKPLGESERKLPS